MKHFLLLVLLMLAVGAQGAEMDNQFQKPASRIVNTDAEAQASLARAAGQVS